MEKSQLMSEDKRVTPKTVVLSPFNQRTLFNAKKKKKNPQMCLCVAISAH